MRRVVRSGFHGPAIYRIGRSSLCRGSDKRIGAWVTSNQRQQTREIHLYSDINRSAIDFGGDAESAGGSVVAKKKSPTPHTSTPSRGNGQGGPSYTILRDAQSAVDVRAWLGRRREPNGEHKASVGYVENKGSHSTNENGNDGIDLFEVPMERAARQQLGLLSRLSRRVVEGNSSGGKAAPVPRWMNDLNSIPNYAAANNSATHHSQNKSGTNATMMMDIIPYPIAVMPDVHFGNGTTVGTVIPTHRALIPNSVGVDIGCGMLAMKTSLRHADLCGNTAGVGVGDGSNGGKDRLLANLRMAIEIAVPHGRTHSGAEGNDAGGWRSSVPRDVADIWNSELKSRFDAITAKYPVIARSNNVNHLGTLGTGNHFIEICVEESPLVPSSPIGDNYGGNDNRGGGLSGKIMGNAALQRLHPQVFGLLEGLGKRGNAEHAVDLLSAYVEEEQRLHRERGGSVWIMLHSGSRGVGGKIGNTFIDIAKREMGQFYGNLPSGDLAYLSECDIRVLDRGSLAGGTTAKYKSSYFQDYCEALSWAQDFARWNREIMAARVVAAMRATKGIPKDFTTEAKAVNCHHNYVERTNIRTGEALPWGASGALLGSDTNSYPELDPNVVYLTRKGATSARKGELAIIPGSMGARSFIVQGKGNLESYCSCSHGAGRQYSRGETKRRFTNADHEAATKGVECRKDADVIDETPMAYKDIDTIIRAQEDLVDVVCVLKQVLCVKG